MTSTECYPWFHAAYEPLRVGPQVTVKSGCFVGNDGNINCDPEAMRANAEAQLRASGILSNLSLEAYTLARYMQGEVGSGTVEERVAVGEAAVNRAKVEGRNGVLDVLLFRQPQGHPNRGKYGPIHGVGAGVSTAPYGRWATTSADPTILTLLLANLVATGESGNFSGGADDQDGIEFQSAFPNIPFYVQNLAKNHKFWVGPLPGVDHWHTFLQTTLRNETDKTPIGAARVAATLQALEGRVRPVWPANLPVCGKPASSSLLWGIGLLGAIFGGWWAMRNTTTTHAV